MAVPTKFIATAYGPPWGGIQGSGTTAGGTKLPTQPTGKVGPPYLVAVDPTVIPLGTRLKIWPNPAGDPNIVWTADDTGGDIKGARIDFLDLAGRTSQDAWGRQPVTVTPTTEAASSGAPAVSAPNPVDTTSTTPPTTDTSSSSSGPSTWVKLLLDVAVLAVGAAAIYRGGKHLVTSRKAA